ncbi:tubulin monoglycylase TTLL3 isoform X3 [Gasterosteus aculeatus]|uniref:Tubulin tyrosine ligase-like family, member 3 n=1 Tax=Gasterosteus aculeatus aculeatus TaxID=481459 RepID=G3P592_GASAC
MRADVSMEATRSKQSVQQGRDKHQATATPNATYPGGDTPPKGKACRSFVRLTVLKQETLKKAKAMAENAVKMHKVFSVQGPYSVVRTALRARGWVEQRMHCPTQNNHRHPGNESRACNTDADNSGSLVKEQDPDGLYGLMSRLVRNEMVYFYWTNRRDTINTNSLKKEQITNHFAKSESFTTKVGLCVNLRNLYWFDSADPDTFFPRCYRPGAQDEMPAFIADYRRTACSSFLKYIVEREQGVQRVGNSHSIRDVKKPSKLPSSPVILSQMLDSALKVCHEFLESLEHRDIDIRSETPPTLTKEEWTEFINGYYLAVHEGVEIENSDRFVTCCKAMLQRLREVSPQQDIDGTDNIWIIKPAAKSRGRGIKCARRLDRILSLVGGDPTLKTNSKWVVQKYLERPLLVHGTKFDIRQWFLVTAWNPLTVWFYKKCYVRFATQPYSLHTLDSSVHLCNNSIQKHLTPSRKRHCSIPVHNMWSDDQFRRFLSSQGREAEWQTVIVPGMKEALIHTVQTTQDQMESRKNSFELYGADFMLGQDLRPWLIEINSSPTMAASTPVTARLCTAVQEDTLRIVLDWTADHTANTGDFELIHKPAAVDVPQYVGVNLNVDGYKIPGPCSLPPMRSPNRSTAKRHGPVKKQPKAEKVTPLPKLLSKSAQSQINYISKGVTPPPAPPLPPVPAPVKIFSPNLPMTITANPLHISPASNSVLLWKRKPKEVQPHTSLSLSKTVQTSSTLSDFVNALGS